MATAKTQQPGPVTLQGIGVSPGVVVGPVYLMSAQGPEIRERKISADEVAGEIYRLEEALIETRKQIKQIQRDLEQRTGLGDASILDAHLMVLDDRTFIEEVVTDVREKLHNVEAAVRDVAARYAEVLGSVADDYLRERVSDVRDIARRLVRSLLGDHGSSLADLKGEHILVAMDLAPSDTAGLGKEGVAGIATDQGSATSHTAVMARALEIPALVGLHDVSRRVANGDEVLIDGNRGVLIIHPSPRELREYGKVADTRRNVYRRLSELKEKTPETTDGHRISVSANIESPDEIASVLEHGAQGVGLFRSEYLFFSRGGVLDEDEQAEVYDRIANGIAPNPLIIRSLDLGGDKFLPGIEMAPEPNPFLGCRSIRLCLRYPDAFKTQLRAVLRASVNRNVKLMYPMISNVSEVIQANRLLDAAKNDLRGRKIDFNPDLEVGVMIEIPGAALTADAIAREVNFFSLGTNDLIQYTLAVDRVNEQVNYLYEPTHPAILKLIRMTIEAGHRHGIWVGLCGEMAADPTLSALLLGLGVDELSVAPWAVPLVKGAVRSVSREQAQGLADRALSSGSAAEVAGLCLDLTRETAPELLELR